MRPFADICEPLVISVLGYNLPPNRVFVGSACSGLDSEVYLRSLVVEHKNGDIIIDERERGTGIELRAMGSAYSRLSG